MKKFESKLDNSTTNNDDVLITTLIDKVHVNIDNAPVV